MPPLGRECASYYWTQDGTHMYATIPLPNKVAPRDVSLALSEEEFSVSIVNQPDFLGVSGGLGGRPDPTGTDWAVVDDPVDGPSLEVRILKAFSTGVSTYWQSLLVGEESHPTVQYSGICTKTGVRFRQRRDVFEIELDVPPTVSSDDVRIDVDPDFWMVSIKDTDISFAARLYSDVVPEDTVWAVEGGPADDNKILDITVHKSRKGAPDDDSAHWWPRLSA